MLLTEFRTRLEQTPCTNFLIAFSGGLDSTALLSLFAKLRKNRPHFRLRAVHIHHGLSPNADRWAAHCRQICTRLDIPLIVEKVRINKQNGIEAGAREARYQAIGRHLQAHEILVTAHHLQDQTETFLLALKRGSGIQGLSAMQPQSTIYHLPVFRPLLDFTRAQLEDYVKAEQLSWIEDESNDDNRYERNFLRNEILPPLRRRWADFDRAVRRSARHCFEQQQLINELLAEEFSHYYTKTEHTLDISSFARFSLHKRRALLRLWLKEQNLAMPSQVQSDQLIKDVIFARRDANPEFMLADKVVRRYRNKLYLTGKLADLSRFNIPVTFNQQIELPDNLGYITVTKEDEFISLLWNDHRVRLPLTEAQIQIRFGYTGKVRLQAKGARQDIKKVWQRLEVPPWQRSRIPLIFYDETLKSAVGFFDVFEAD